MPSLNTSAVEIAKAVKKGEITSEELVKNYASYENVECYNCGIASYTGKKNITTVDYENFCKDWYMNYLKMPH